MSLFKARDWSSTWCGSSEEEFDYGSLSIANIDNDPSQFDKVVVGSLNGIIRIYVAQHGGFKPEDLMLEMQLSQPILQLKTGKFVSGTDQLHIAILHPRNLSVYNVTAMTASVEHANYFTLSLVYEHRLDRTAFSMTCGPFGGVKDKDFICVLSMDGVLSFYEQETFSLQSYLPDFLLPGPIIYLPVTDSFLIATAARNLECYKHHTLASTSNEGKGSSKKATCHWSKSVGDHILDINIVNTSQQTMLIILGERSLLCMSTSGDIEIMKKLEYNPSCLYSYTTPERPDTIITLVGSHSSSLLIYEGIQLVWAAQLPHIPVVCRYGNFQELSGVLVTLNEYGHLYCSYLGTDPSLFVAPNVETRSSNFQELESELKELNKIIKDSNNGAGKTALESQKEALLMSAKINDHLDEISQVQLDELDSEPEDLPPSITAKITLECTSIRPIESITVCCSVKYPIITSQPQKNIPILGNKGPVMEMEMFFYTLGDAMPSDLEVVMTATYVSESEAPRVIQTSFHLPLNLICNGTQPVKQATHKLTIDTNKEPVNLAELFPEMVDDAVIPVPVLGLQYIGGPVVTILSSKQSNRYRIQCDLFEAMSLVVIEILRRLRSYFERNKDGSKFKATFQGPVPLNEYFQLIDNHFEQRLCMENYKEMLNQRAQQFRVIQKRLLTRFKDKTPSPLSHLDTILDGTYKQILALGEEYENAQSILTQTSNSLSNGTRLVHYLIRLMVGMNEKDYNILTSSLTHVVVESNEHGWEEMVNSNISFLLRTSLAKSIKEQNTSLPTLTMEKDTGKLKRNIALMCERLNKGASLSKSQSIEKLSLSNNKTPELNQRLRMSTSGTIKEETE